MIKPAANTTIFLGGVLLGIGAASVILRNELKDIREDKGVDEVIEKIYCPRCDQLAWTLVGVGGLVVITGFATSLKK